MAPRGGEDLRGLGGAATLDGQGGGDRFFTGPLAEDRLTGGLGKDSFFIADDDGAFVSGPGVVHITDFAVGDMVVVQFGAFPANPGLRSGGSASLLEQGQVLVAAPSGGTTRMDVGLDTVPGGDLTVVFTGELAASIFFVESSSSLLVRFLTDVRLALTGTDAELEVVRGGTANDNCVGLGGRDQLYGYAGDDTLLGGEGDDNLYAGDGNDTVEGGPGADFIFSGWVGLKRLSGGDGADTINGGGENDFIDGGAGDDVMIGSHGVDTMAGGPGDDSYASMSQVIASTRSPGRGMTRSPVLCIWILRVARPCGRLRPEVRRQRDGQQ